MAELAYWLTTALLLALLGFLLFHRQVGAWADRMTARINRLTVAIDAASERARSDEWADASFWETLTGRRRRQR